MGLIVGLNLLFNMVYDRWTAFVTIVGFVIGFVTFLVLDGTGRCASSTCSWAWALIGGIAAATASCLPSAQRQPVPRFRLGLAGFGGLVLPAVAVDDAYQPELDWGKLLSAP